MADVNLLFCSPLSPKKILVYGLVHQTGMTVLMGAVLLFQAFYPADPVRLRFRRSVFNFCGVCAQSNGRGIGSCGNIRGVQRKSTQKKMDSTCFCRPFASLGGWRAVAGRGRKAGHGRGNADFVLSSGRTVSLFRMAKRRNPFSNGNRTPSCSGYTAVLLCFCSQRWPSFCAYTG